MSLLRKPKNWVQMKLFRKVLSEISLLNWSNLYKTTWCHLWQIYMRKILSQFWFQAVVKISSDYGTVKCTILFSRVLKSVKCVVSSSSGIRFRLRSLTLLLNYRTWFHKKTCHVMFSLFWFGVKQLLHVKI